MPAAMTAPLDDTRKTFAPEQPRVGDIVVAADAKSPEYYAIRQVPGTPQVSWAPREQALEVAAAYAQRHAVDLWIVDERGARRVETVRSTGHAVTPRPAPSPARTMRVIGSRQ
jgi:hypothetical protein